jgi:hypothetical protein
MAAKLMTAEMTKLPLKYEVRKVGMICFAKPGLTEDLYMVQKEEFLITRDV